MKQNVNIVDIGKLPEVRNIFSSERRKFISFSKAGFKLTSETNFLPFEDDI